MAFDAHPNFAFSTLAAGGVVGSSSAATLNLLAGDGAYFPDPATVGAYNLVVFGGNQPSLGGGGIATNVEIMRCTAKSGDALTVTRAQETTTARSTFAVGHRVMAGVTAKSLTDIESKLTAGGISISAAGTGTTALVSVQATGDGAGLGSQGLFVKSWVGDDTSNTAAHAATIYTTGTGNTAASALNVVSDNTAFSAMQLTGKEKNRGTLKIAHKGQSDASDASAAAISIDLQTTEGGVTGTAAQGLFITSTTDTAPAGNSITVRYNSLDTFVIKSNGTVGIGVAIGHAPAGMLEIAQKDTSTVGLFIQAIGSGTDLVSLKDSGGNQRFQINNAGNTIHRANCFVTTSLQIGSASGDFGGGSAAISIKHATDPTTNPTAGAIVYVDASGNLLCRTSAGNVRTIAAV